MGGATANERGPHSAPMLHEDIALLGDGMSEDVHLVTSLPSDRADMRTIDVHEAQKRLASLVDEAARGESFVIAKEGKPLVKVAALDAPAAPRRLGFLAGQIVVPDDFDRMGEAEIATLFGAEL